MKTRRATDELALLREAPFTAADRMLAEHLRSEWSEDDPWILLAAALSSLAAREGHAYLDLSRPNERKLRLPRQ